MTEPKNAVLLIPHNEAEDWHQWVLIPGFKGNPVEVKLDAQGRRHRHAWRKWLVLMCNNSKCPARIAIRNGFIADFAESQIPAPKGPDDDR